MGKHGGEQSFLQNSSPPLFTFINAYGLTDIVLRNKKENCLSKTFEGPIVQITDKISENTALDRAREFQVRSKKHRIKDVAFSTEQQIKRLRWKSSFLLQNYKRTQEKPIKNSPEFLEKNEMYMNSNFRFTPNKAEENTKVAILADT